MDHFVKWFRNSTPYINAHRGKTFVVCIGGEAVASPGFPDLVQDLTLLASLGVRLVLVHGIGPQFAQRLERAALELDHHDGIPVLPTAGLPALKNAIGATRLDIEAAFSSGLPQTPMDGAGLRVVAGNFVIARPVGVRGGVDFQSSGTVEKLQTSLVERTLSEGQIPIFPNIGWNARGKPYNISSNELALTISRELKAAKLFFITDFGGVSTGQFSEDDAEKLIDLLQSYGART